MQNHQSAGRSRPLQPSSRAARPHGSARFGRPAAVLGFSAVMVLTATGCFGDSRPAPQETATALAGAISAGDYSTVSLTPESEDVPEQLTEALADLEDVDRTVTVASAEVDGEDNDRATATLTVDWQLDGDDADEDAEASTGEGPGASGEASSSPEASAGTGSERTWSYETTAEMRWDEEAQEWLVELAPETVVPQLAEGGTVNLTTVPAERGSILDAAGEELMMERDVAILGLDKSHLEADDPDALADAARQVAEVAGVDEDAFVAQAEAAGEKAFVQAITVRNNGDTEIPADRLLAIPGGRILEDTAVLAPTRAFARDVLGTYGEPDAEQVEASEGELEAGVEVGLSGLQATWEDHLAGTPGVQITIDNPDQPDTGASGTGSSNSPSTTAAASPTAPEGPVFSTDPAPGQDLTSTLNRRVQEEAEAVVAASDVPAGLVALRPSDGQVLAAASSPEGWPVAVSGSYAPGSTFKVVTALAMLRSGIAPGDTVQCPETLNVGGMVVGNYDGYPDASVGEIPFSEAFAESCNTVFVGAHEEVSAADEAEAAEALGLTAEPVTGLDSAFLGSIPDDSTGTEHAANLFGQGVVEASPLGMATVAASVAAGHTVRPLFVTDPAVEAPAAPESGVTAEEAEQLQALMAGVVETGTAEMLQDVPGAPVLAKTGTAQFVADGEDLAHTWLVAVHGDLAVALFFNEGLGGGHDNGPVVRDFLTAVEEIIPSEG
ncbi:penicillin-binding transpeptidase domain-containing protein [Citricoccus sp. K5]|uniref:penicillin-binding transpeptidase domain-containing protein n=1 Tax=Citricoccus sp. K5 TaxID=2653135 RepID=UPI0012EF06EC|nr:penicillin-binding transpeptidase domain-containing protein [Citricoccus sp. K5]VXB79483.1 Beta-lactamase [Citricoccus sp. K5]